jgi:lysozyme family protein
VVPKQSILISQYVDVNVVESCTDMTEGRLAMVVQGLLGKAAGTVVTGLVGVSAYEILRKALGKAPIHDAAVTATEWGLRGTRRAEEAAESARLKLADVVAEARERVGEEAQPPAIGDHDHDHEH